MALISRFLASRTLRWGFAALSLAFGVWYVAEKWGGIHSGLNRIGLKPPGIIAILQAIKTAGALQADLVVQ